MMLRWECQAELPEGHPLSLTNIKETIEKNTRDFELELEFVVYQEINVLGFMTQTTLANGQQAKDICQFANQVIAQGKLAQYFDLSQTPIYGVYTNMTDQDEFNYTIACLRASQHTSSDQLLSHTLPSHQYARFRLSRNDRIKEAWHYIYGKWFLEQHEARAKGLDFEIYHETHTDIYIPMH